MPVTYQIDAVRGLIRTRCFGNLKFDEVLGHFRELEQDPGCPPHLDVLLDLTEVSSLPESRQLQSVAFEIRRIRDKVQFGMCAVIAPTDALFGMLRVFEVMAQDYFLAIAVLRSSSEAEAWLGLQKVRDAG